MTSKDRNIELGVVANAAFTADGTAGSNTILNVSDTTADTGGLTLADGTADGKFIKWLSSNNSWNFNKSLELASGTSITVNGTSVLTGSTVHGKTFVTDFSTVDHSVIPTVGAINEAVAKKVTAASYYSGSF